VSVTESAQARERSTGPAPSAQALGDRYPTGRRAGTAVFSNASPPDIDQVDEIAPRAVFLIYALGVDNGDEERFNRAYVGAQDARPREYEQRLTRFFDQTVGREQP
jgi:hypothetical protein